MKGNSEKEPAELATRQADIFLKNGTVLNVYSGELLKMNVVINGERIWYVGPRSDMVGDDTIILDAENRLIVPGYVDPHFHPWNIYNPISFGEEACRLGTTTVVGDSLVFHLLMGTDLFEVFMHLLSHMPVKFFWTCRAAPQTPMEREDEFYAVENLERLLKNPEVQSLGEITRWPELVKGNPKYRELIRRTKGLKKRVDGHTAGARYDDLNVISRVGVESCHESITGEEVLDRLRLGLYVMIRESSLRQDLGKLIKTVAKSEVLTDRIMLTTDSSEPDYYERFGINDNLIRIAIREGIEPISVYRMSTINPAVYFGLDHEIGGIAPGRYADILLLRDLHQPTPELVISRGRIMAENGKLVEPFPQLNWESFFPRSSFSRRKWKAESHFFQIPSHRKRIRFPTIKLISPVITQNAWVEFDMEDGFLTLDERRGFCFSALMSRDGSWVTNGILQGFGDAIEGMASSFNTAVEILVLGRDPEAMRSAVNRVLELGGGIVAFENGKIAYEFPLPLGGIMSDEPMQRLAEKDRELQAFLSKRGYPFETPLFTLLFLPNDFLPDVRINYKGVVDIRKDTVLWPRRVLASG
ncbi:MAG: adenine deaminase C-terminal domain-containing protein [Desulfobacteraceae bacterium]|jgi:adenine deaminase